MANTSINTALDQRTLSLQSRYSRLTVDGSSAQAAGVGGVEAVAGSPSTAAIARNQLNVQILQVSVEVSLQAGDQSQALLFRSAIERINELLAPELGPDAIQAKIGEDNSPEATAGRILSLSTGFFEAYAAQHEGEDSNELARNFVDLIRSGFEQGFKEAVEILKGLQVFSGDIESGVMKTYELVSKGYDDFLAGKLPPASDAEAKTEARTAA